MPDASQMLLVDWVHRMAREIQHITREDVEAVIQYHAQREESFDELRPLLAAVNAAEQLRQPEKTFRTASHRK